MKRSLCIYHANCADGFASAWVVNRSLSQTGRAVELLAANYDDLPPDNIDDADVYIVDFSYSREVMLAMSERTASLTIIDHHKSAIEKLASIGNFGTTEHPIYTHFDTGRSGAMLTWEYFYGSADAPPQLLRYVQDRDLWQFALPDTHEITAAVHSYEYDMHTWDGLIKRDVRELVVEGRSLLRKYTKDLKSLVAQSNMRMKLCGYDVPVANVPGMYASDAGHIMGMNEPFAVTYHDVGKGRKFSLRSQQIGGIDVTLIAQLFKGGGHKNAAGFFVTRDDPKHELLTGELFYAPSETEV